jgi:hypothetical protein
MSQCHHLSNFDVHSFFMGGGVMEPVGLSWDL